MLIYFSLQDIFYFHKKIKFVFLLQMTQLIGKVRF